MDEGVEPSVNLEDLQFPELLPIALAHHHAVVVGNPLAEQDRVGMVPDGLLRGVVEQALQDEPA